MLKTKPVVLALMWMLVIAWASFAGRAFAKPAAYHPVIDPANFQAAVDNPYFPLVPGTTFKFIETVGKKSSDNTVTVTRETKVIMGVTCVVVHDQLARKGHVEEDTYDWYAQDKQGNVWYLGEATREFGPHGEVSTEGSWEAGVDGAQPGIVMMAQPIVGDPYRQEYYPGQAEDMGQVVGLNESVKVPYGAIAGCVRTKEWSMLKPGDEKKWYARGLGCVRTETSGKEVATLVAVTKP